MSKLIKSVVSKLLRGLADKIESDSCELNEQQAMEIMSVIGHNILSKDEACSYLNLSRSRFDALVLEGKIPRGKKKRGFKELFWYEDELFKIQSLQSQVDTLQSGMAEILSLLKKENTKS